MKQEKECIRSPAGNHELVYPRLEDSIDKNRPAIEPYCKYCFQKTKIIQMKNLIELFKENLADVALEFSGEISEENFLINLFNNPHIRKSIAQILREETILKNQLQEYSRSEADERGVEGLVIIEKKDQIIRFIAYHDRSNGIH